MKGVISPKRGRGAVCKVGGGLEGTERGVIEETASLIPSPVGSRSEVGVGKRSEGPTAEEVCPGSGAPFPEGGSLVPSMESGSSGAAAKSGPHSPRAAGTAAQPGARVGSAAAGPRPLRPPPPALTEVVHGWSSDAGPRLDVALAARLGAAPRRPATFLRPASARNGTRCRAASSATAAAAAARARGRLATPPRARWPRPVADPEHAQSREERKLGVVVATPGG